MEESNNRFEHVMKMDWGTGLLIGNGQLIETAKRLGQLENVFLDEAARRRMNPDIVVYRVQAWCPMPEGTEGGQFWGTTVVEPGIVGSEYFMTHGHYHRKRDRTEFYGTVEGEGGLIIMSEDRETRMEPMSPGSLHFIPPNTAHRVANTGTVPLRFVACWPSDAGHDYQAIREHGFGARLLSVQHKPALVRSGR